MRLERVSIRFVWTLFAMLVAGCVYVAHVFVTRLIAHLIAGQMLGAMNPACDVAKCS